MLEQERRRAEEEAARLEAERQAALLAKEELARLAEAQKKSKEQLVSIMITRCNQYDTERTLPPPPIGRITKSQPSSGFHCS